jgi:hypothetical protein
VPAQLDVKLTRSITVGPMLERSRVALSRLLNIDDVPALVAWQVKRSGLEPLAAHDIVPQGLWVAVGWADRPRGLVEIMVVPVEAVPGFVSDEEAGLYATINVMERWSLPHALVLACAISIAELCGTSVEDDEAFWTSTAASSPDAVLQALSLQHKCSSVEEAAEVFMRSIPQGRRKPTP